MKFQMVDSSWENIFKDALRTDSSHLRIVCPFVKEAVVRRLLKQNKPRALQVITRFNLSDFYDGVSDTSAMRMLLQKGAQIRGIKGLHAKLYLFGRSRVIVTSANLTDAALSRNHEFGFVAEDVEIIKRCHDYFDDLWRKAGNNLSNASLAKWEEKLAPYRRQPINKPRLGDKGVSVYVGELTKIITIAPAARHARQGFVKFSGEGSNRAERTLSTEEACDFYDIHTYPKGKRPRKVKEGAVIFFGRLVKYPNDIIVFGRSVAHAHKPGRDDATPKETKETRWLKKWPHYVRVHDVEILKGNLGNGILLCDLMNDLEENAFMSTQRNASARNGKNTNPRMAYRSQASVNLSTHGIKWLNKRLDRAFDIHGKFCPKDKRP